jgi:hypothetical protein
MEQHGQASQNIHLVSVSCSCRVINPLSDNVRNTFDTILRSALLWLAMSTCVTALLFFEGHPNAIASFCRLQEYPKSIKIHSKKVSYSVRKPA